MPVLRLAPGSLGMGALGSSEGSSSRCALRSAQIEAAWWWSSRWLTIHDDPAPAARVGSTTVYDPDGMLVAGVLQWCSCASRTGGRELQLRDVYRQEDA